MCDNVKNEVVIGLESLFSRMKWDTELKKPQQTRPSNDAYRLWQMDELTDETIE